MSRAICLTRGLTVRCERRQQSEALFEDGDFLFVLAVLEEAIRYRQIRTSHSSATGVHALFKAGQVEGLVVVVGLG